MKEVMKPIPRISRQARLKPGRVTGRKYALVKVPTVFVGLADAPRDQFRPHVASLSSQANAAKLKDLSIPFLQETSPRHVIALPVQRLWAEEYGSYPLRRTQLVTFNREQGRLVIAELKPASTVLGIRGLGLDEDSALKHLERQFDRLVREKVRIPPHARKDRDEPIRRIVNYLVDWDRLEQENPLPQTLWGMVVNHSVLGRTTVRWLMGPDGIRKKTTSLPAKYRNPWLTRIPKGSWFRAVIKEYPNRIEWLEPPYQVPDPEDRREQQKAWAAIPVILADDENVWPLKED